MKVKNNKVKKTMLNKVNMKKRSLVSGVGVNDYPYPCKVDGIKRKSYIVWNNMLNRCYGNYNVYASYKVCEVQDEWKYYSTFKEWFDMNYKDKYKGWHLDKDILVPGNKVYGPNTCMFVPESINALLKDFQCSKLENSNIQGIYVYDREGKPYRIKRNNKLYTYATLEEAIAAYSEYKREYSSAVIEKEIDKGHIDRDIGNKVMSALEYHLMNLGV